jgi:hypothetical protein
MRGDPSELRGSKLHAEDKNNAMRSEGLGLTTRAEKTPLHKPNVKV